MTIRLCVDCRMISNSGIGTFIKNVVPFFIQDRFQLTVILSQKGLKEAPWKDSCHYRVCNAPIYSIQEQLSLPLEIPACDIFWSPHFNIPIFPIRARKRVVSVQDVYHLAFFSKLTLLERGYASFMYRMAAARSDEVIVHSQFTASEMHKHLRVSAQRLRVVPLGVNKEACFARSKEVKQGVREKYHLPSSFFLFVGNLKSHKNIRVILEALKLTKNLDHSLIVVGKKEGLLNIDPELRIAESDLFLQKQVFFLENVDDEDLRCLYQMAEALIFPSLYEGFGLPPLEAMANGCPVIVSQAASLPEVCGDAVRYVDPVNVSDVAEAMKQVKDDGALRESLVGKGRHRIQQFSWEATARRYQEVFEQTV